MKGQGFRNREFGVAQREPFKLSWAAAPGKKYILHHRPGHADVWLDERVWGGIKTQRFAGVIPTFTVPGRTLGIFCSFLFLGGESFSYFF